MAQSPIQQGFAQDIGTMLSRRGQIPGEIKAKQEELAQTTERGMADIRGAEQMLSEAVGGVQERYAGGVRSAQEEAGRSMRDVAFEPTRENLPELTQLFGMLTAATFLAGGKGRQSGMGALAAITGAMEGYRKGQKEVYNNELREFDKRIREVQAHNQNVRNKLNDALTTLKTDREAGMAKLKGLEMEIAGSQAQLKLRRGDIQGVVKSLAEEQKAVTQALGKAYDMEQRAARDVQRYQMEQARLQQGERRLQLAEEAGARKSQATGEGKPPPKEIVNSNSLRNTLIPKLEKAIPVLDRLNKEGKWSKLTSLLGVDSRIAEYEFRNDPEAVDLILTLAYFRSKEFETAGKALTRNEDKILAPIVRGDFRAYEGLRNAMVRSKDTLKAEQKGFEKLYPAIKNYNEALRGETEAVAPQTQTTPQRAYMGTRPIIVENGKWVYEDTKEEVK